MQSIISMNNFLSISTDLVGILNGIFRGKHFYIMLHLYENFSERIFFSFIKEICRNSQQATVDLPNSQAVAPLSFDFHCFC